MMGTERCDYVILGYKFDSLYAYQEHMKEVLPKVEGDEDGYKFEAAMEDWEEQYQDNPYKDEPTNKHEMVIVSDGMNGKYVIAGKMLVKGSECCGLDMVDCTPDGDTAKRVREWLGSTLKIVAKPRVWALSHWH
jgi:hypothetical protein